MKTLISNRVNMINVCVAYCDANAPATAGIPSFEPVLDAVKAKMVLINSLNQIGSGTTTGVTLDTNGLREAMTALAFKCASATLAFANATGNNTLAAQVNYTDNQLNKLKKEVVDDVCQSILDATSGNMAGAGPYGVVPTDLTDLQAAIDLYRVSSQNPRQAIITKSQAIRQLEEMVKEVTEDLLKDQLDKMANTLKFTNSNFWFGYKQAREIVDLGHTHAKIRGTVTSSTGVPLAGVQFKVFAAGTTTEVGSGVSDSEGKYSSGTLPAGMVDLRWMLPGYRTLDQPNIEVVAGQEQTRSVMLQALVTEVIEGAVAGDAVANISTPDLDIPPTTQITLEAMGSALRFYGASTPNAEPGGIYVDVMAGQSVSYDAQTLGLLLGMNDVNTFVNVRNLGGVPGYYKLTFVM